MRVIMIVVVVHMTIAMTVAMMVVQKAIIMWVWAMRVTMRVAASMRMTMVSASVIKHKYAYQIDKKAQYGYDEESLVGHFRGLEHSLQS